MQPAENAFYEPQPVEDVFMNRSLAEDAFFVKRSSGGRFL